MAASPSTSPAGAAQWLSRLAGRLRHPVMQSDAHVPIDRLICTGEDELHASQRCLESGHRNRAHMHAQSASQLLRRAVERAALSEAVLTPEVYAELAEAYALLGQSPEEAPTESPTYWEELARRGLEDSQWEEARRALLHLVHENPAQADEVLELLGHIAAVDGQWAAPLQAPEAAAIWYPLGRQALEAGQPTAAMALWTAAAREGDFVAVAEAALSTLRHHPDLTVRQQAAGLLLDLGPGTAYCCAAALEILPIDATLARRLCQRADALADSAEDELALEEGNRAMLQAILAHGPFNADAVGLLHSLRTNDAALLFEVGVAVGDAGMHAAAYGLLRRAANLAPPTAAGYALLADAARAAGRVDEVAHWTMLRHQAVAISL